MKGLLHLKSTSAAQAPVATIDALGLAIGALATAAVFFLGIQPMIDHRHHLQAQRETLAQEQERAEELSRTAQQLRANLQATRRAAERNPMRLASIRALNARLSEMTELGTATGLKIERIQPGQRHRGDHYHTVPIKLTGQGAFGANTRFLHRLHESFPDVAIASLSLSGRPDRASSDEAPQFDLTLLWYAAPPASNGEQR